MAPEPVTVDDALDPPLLDELVVWVTVTVAVLAPTVARYAARTVCAESTFEVAEGPLEPHAAKMPAGRTSPINIQRDRTSQQYPGIRREKR
jgi:hypothetical protein